MSRRFLTAALATALLVLPTGTGAQTRAAIVVPADAAVVVPPRGSPAALPRAVAARPSGQRPRLPPMTPARGEGGLGLGGAGTVAAALVPAIAAAALTAVLSNGGGGSGGHGASGPARTR